MTGSQKGRLNLADLKKSLYAFLAVFLPIFFFNLLQNMDQLQEIFVNWLNTFELPTWQMLIIMPAVVALFVVIKQWLTDNSEKEE